MPYIRTQVSIELPAEKEQSITQKLGQAIAILGKTERWLMLNFEDQCRLHFQGNQDAPTAFVEIKLFGKASSAMYQNMTETVTQILSEELSIPGNRIYVQYQECDHWGWNGSNF